MTESISLIRRMKKERAYDSEVYDLLKRIASNKYKTVKMIEEAGIITNALFFDDILNTTDFPYEKRKAIRQDWHAKEMNALSPVQLIFADPDNGTIGTKSSANKDAEKYTTLEELVDYYNRGQDVLYYCQRARRPDDQWTDKKNELKVVLPDVKIAVLTFKRGTQRSYIFGIHSERYAKYNQLIEGGINTDWGDCRKEKDVCSRNIKQYIYKEKCFELSGVGWIYFIEEKGGQKYQIDMLHNCVNHLIYLCHRMHRSCEDIYSLKMKIK